jgi:hypothetical protein
MSPPFKLQSHCSTRAVQLQVKVFHLVFHLHMWFVVVHVPHCPHYTPSAVVILCDVRRGFSLAV